MGARAPRLTSFQVVVSGKLLHLLHVDDLAATLPRAIRGWDCQLQARRRRTRVEHIKLCTEGQML